MPAAAIRSWFHAQHHLVKFFIFVIPAVGLAAFIALAPSAADSEWVCLVDGRDAAAREQIRQKLSHRGIGVDSRGSALWVRKQDQSRAVMSLAGDGVLGDSELFRFLDETNFTSTHWQMDKRWQVALQLKLERMIRELDSVQDAYVQITPGTEARTLGVRDAEGGKASVVVTLKPGRKELGTSEIQGIAHLVSASVKGLKPEGVKIMDRRGNLYKLGAEDSRWSNVSDRHELERRYERDLEAKAQKVMAASYPNATVSAFVKLSSRRIVQRETQVAPEGATKYVEEVSGSGMKGLKSLAIPEMQPVEGVAYESRRQVEIEPGEVEQASMAIALPMEAAPKNFAAEEERIRRLVQNATGVAEADISIQVIPIPARVTDEPLPSAPNPSTDPFAGVWAALGAAIVLLAVLAFAIRRVRPSSDLAPLREAVRAALQNVTDNRVESLGPRSAAMLISLLDSESSRAVLARFQREFLESVLVELVGFSRTPPPAREIRSALSRLA
jgi:flagellar biosynthesis/type III secretory pathway M-ring protein FliF/YscJ